MAKLSFKFIKENYYIDNIFASFKQPEFNVITVLHLFNKPFCTLFLY